RVLGADVLICSDVTDPLEPRDSIVSLVDVLVQSVSFRVWDSEAEQRSKCDVLILPEVRGFSTFGFARARDVIARGEAAARAALPGIAAALAKRRVSRRAGAPRSPVIEPESVLVTSVRFDPPDLVPGGFLARALGVRPGSGVSRPLGDGRSFTLGAAADYVRSPFDLYQGDHRVAQARVDLGAITTSIARSAGTLADASLRAKVEYARWAEEVSAVASNPIYR